MYRKIVSIILAVIMSICVFPAVEGSISYADASIDYDDYYDSSELEVEDVCSSLPWIVNEGDTPIKLIQQVYFEDGTLLTKDSEIYNEKYSHIDLEKIIKSGGEGCLEAPFVVTIREINKAVEGDYFVIEFIVDEYTADWYDSTKEIKEGMVIVDGDVVPDIYNLREDGDISFNVEIDGSIIKTYTIKPGESSSYEDQYYENFYELLKGKTLELDKRTYDEDNQTLTYSFIDVSDDVSSERMNEMEAYEKKLQEKLDVCSREKLNIKVADPSDIGIPGWNKREAVGAALDIDAFVLEYGLDSVIFPNNNTFYSLMPYFYEDKEKTKPIITDDHALSELIAPGQTVYIDLRYEGRYGWEDIQLVRSLSIKEPIEAEYNFVDVKSNSKEINQIKKNLSIKNVDIVFDDLAWVNILSYVEYEPRLISASHADSMLKSRNPNIYDSMVGDSSLDIKVPFGRAGTSTSFSKDTLGVVMYYVDDLFYYCGANNESGVHVKMINSLYVAENSKDRAKDAEKRIKKYMGDNSYKVSVNEFSKEGLAEFAIDTFNEGEYRNLKNIKGEMYAYLTEYGVAVYNDPDKTGKEEFVELLPFVETDVFEKGKIEATGDTLEYVDLHYDGYANNVKAYKAYKLSLKDSDYLYVIGKKPEAQLENPLADWEDNDSGIITEGENGQVVTDFYTKIRKIGKDDIKVISKKVNGKDVNAFDINAFTNFKEEGITNLGNGIVKVMIPLEDFSEKNLKAFYYDQNGNMQYLDYVIEEQDEMKYVCFMTNHFSTYGITGDRIQAQAEDKDKGYSEVDTGDDFNTAIPIAVSLLALAVMVATITFRKRIN